jgi:excisionase family DNA binding protein
LFARKEYPARNEGATSGSTDRNWTSGLNNSEYSLTGKGVNRMHTGKRLLTTDEAATYIGVSPETLRLWASQRRLIPIIKIGKLVRYDVLDLDDFILSQRIAPVPV